MLVSDLSFISLTKVLENLKTLLNPEYHEMVCLIKPQFEAGKEKVEKGGVVRSRQTHKEVIDTVLNFAENLGYAVKGLTYSSIKGPSGNIEYLVWLEYGSSIKYDTINIESVVNEAFEKLNQ